MSQNAAPEKAVPIEHFRKVFIVTYAREVMYSFAHHTNGVVYFQSIHTSDPRNADGKLDKTSIPPESILHSIEEVELSFPALTWEQFVVQRLDRIEEEQNNERITYLRRCKELQDERDSLISLTHQETEQHSGATYENDNDLSF